MWLIYSRDGVDSAPRVVGSAVIRIGRSFKNDFVVDEPTVSSRHAEVFREGDRLFIMDLGSRNGTRVNDEPVHANASQVIVPGDQILLGDALVKVVGSQEAGESNPLLLHDMDGGVRHLVRNRSIQIGGGPHAHVPIPGAEDAVVTVDEDGGIYLSGIDDGRELELEEVFTVGDQRFKLERRALDLTSETLVTEDPEPPERLYQLVVTLNGVSGPEARLWDPTTGTRHVVSAENRAILLWVLARHRVEALGGADATEDDTWCVDGTVSKAIWGKRGTADANSLHVLVHRLRKELKKAGFDPWFIEKRRKAIRLALRDVSVK